jgi:hypothetical protein
VEELYARVGGETIFVEVNRRCRDVSIRVDVDGDRTTRSTVARVTMDPKRVRAYWAAGWPTLYVGNERDLLITGIFLAEAVATTIAPKPTFRGSDLVGFMPGCVHFQRVHRHISDLYRTIFVRPWKWSPTTTVDVRQCGFPGYASPWDVTTSYKENYPMIVVATPLGRVIVHRWGWRAERYEVRAIVLPHGAGAPDDPRIVRAQNLPLRAYEIAKELVASMERRC